MGIADSPQPADRTWHVLVQMHHGRPLLTCARCGPLPHTDAYAIIRTAVLAHLASHARREHLAAHLRTCRCGAHGCRWHPRHRGCSGPVGLTLTRAAGGRIWRLTDACLTCTAATDHAATVPEPETATPTTGEEAPTPAAGGHHAGDGASTEPEETYVWWDERPEEYGSPL